MSYLSTSIFKTDINNIKGFDAKIGIDGSLVVRCPIKGTHVVLRVNVKYGGDYPRAPPKFAVFGPIGDVNRSSHCDDEGFYDLENLWAPVGKGSWSNGFDLDTSIGRVVDMLGCQIMPGELEHMKEFDAWNDDSKWSWTVNTTAVLLPTEPLEFVLQSEQENIDKIFAATQPLSGTIDEKDMIVLKHALGFGIKQEDGMPTKACCFYTRLPDGDGKEKLMLPILSTRNPVTNVTDQMLPYPHFISVKAFEHGIRKTPKGKDFTHAIPLIMRRGDYDRDAMMRLFKDVGLERIDLFLTILTTMVVLIVDGGLEANAETMMMLTQIMHVMAHELDGPCQAIISNHIATFMRDPGARTKNKTRNLGHFTALVAMASCKHTLLGGNIMAAIMREALTRNMLWLGQYDVQGEIVPKLKAQEIEGFEEVIAATAFASGVKSMRLFVCMTLLQNIMTSEGKTKVEYFKGLDATNGFPSVVEVRRFQRGVEVLHEMKSWPDVLKALGLKVMDNVGIAKQVKRAWNDSKLLGYHTDKTNFSKLQASGVSTILKSGKTYDGIDQGTREVEICDTWSWPITLLGHLFLDTTVIFADAHGNVLGYADYNHLTCSIDHRTVATHSGDIMTPNFGMHRVNIRLSACPAKVTYIYIVLSSWALAMLADIKQPNVSVLSDGHELCRYEVESTLDIKTKQAVVLCRFERATTRGGWTVKAIGKTCMGNASRYDEIMGFIKMLSLESS